MRIGHIGTGTRGWDLIKYTGRTDSAKVVAVCDVYKPHMQRGVERAQNADVKQYRDYKDLLDDPKVEAVVIATPDHWHEQMVIDAANAGKAIYCEKGLTMSIRAAKRMRDVVKKNKTIMQLGHQGRQNPASAEGGKLIREGKLGPVTLVKTGRYSNNPADKPRWRWYGYYTWYNRPDPKQVIKDLDWDRWLGPAPKIDFNERHFWHWRCYWAYGTGQAGDLLSHELDYVQSVLNYGIPDTCMCAGLNAFYKDDREAPDTWIATYQFEKQDCSVIFEGVQNSRRDQTPEFCGREARMVFNAIGQSASRFEIYSDVPAWKMNSRPPEPIYRYKPSKELRWPNHMENFLQCVRTGEKPRCHEDEAFIETATFLMSSESYHKKRQVRWDPDKEEIV
ncbi:MAG: Gfo/Idh/MocA family oxidoreductase [Sedimentisphaerales bacterium]|nr:Gfo/Idh/MocA family oxidoreductase [Sedimentisphaerales bacterium]